MFSKRNTSLSRLGLENLNPQRVALIRYVCLRGRLTSKNELKCAYSLDPLDDVLKGAFFPHDAPNQSTCCSTSLCVSSATVQNI